MSRDGTLRGPVFRYLEIVVSEVKHYAFLGILSGWVDINVSYMYHALTLEAA